MKQYDAILVPGGGLKKDSSLNEWAKRRLDKAVEIFSDKGYIIALSAGTTHKPPIIDKAGFRVYESEAAARYLEKKGIAAENILTEVVSLDTIGNAYFARMIHLEPANLRKAVIITSQFHMQRVKEIFGWVFSLAPLPVDYELDYIEVSDGGIDSEIVALRRQREKKSLENVKELKNKIRTLPQFHRWLFRKHAAYAYGTKPQKLSSRLLDSY